MAVRVGSPVISTLCMLVEEAGPSARVRWVAAGIKPRVPHFRSAADTPLPPPDPGHQQCITVHDHSCHIVILSHSHCVTQSTFHNHGAKQYACLVTRTACHTAILLDNTSQSYCQTVILSHSHLVTQSYCHTVILSQSHIVTHSYCPSQFIMQSVLFVTQ